MLKFIRTEGWDTGIADLTERIENEIAVGHKVLWLLSGGSNIAAARQVAANLPANEEAQLGLTVMLNDERYGEVPSHPDSNWHQLMLDGDFDNKARLEATLRPNLSFEENTDYYERLARDLFDHNDIIISQLGLGSDGHIAGIKPNSPAVKESEKLVSGYRWDDHQRMTLTFAALRKVTAVYLFAFGDEKRQALENLRDRALSLEEQPAQVLWEIPEVYVYNDQIGDPA